MRVSFSLLPDQSARQAGREQFSFSPANEAEEIIQNVKLICSTVKGSCPMARSFGISSVPLDMPDKQARALMSAEIFTAVRDWEPRAEIERIDFAEGSTGELIPRITLKGA